MRDGALVATNPVDRWSKQALVNSMLGGIELRRLMARKPPENKPALRVKELSIPGVIGGISFTLHKGEILGIAGLVGSGRTEILRALAGVDPGAEGGLRSEVAQYHGHAMLHAPLSTASRWLPRIDGNKA